MTLCYCDADGLPTPHDAGTIDGVAYCETLYVTPTISPHIYGVGPDGMPLGTRPRYWPPYAASPVGVVAAGARPGL